MTDILPPATSYAVLIFAILVSFQNIRYLIKNCSRRQNMHFGFAILAIYMAGLYLTAILDPANWIIRSGIATKIGILILLWMVFQITRMDERDARRQDS